jgi:glycosyltransferase involved in cell wall biosynthesis
MKILCLDQVSQLGGGQLCLLDLLPAFLESGWEIRVMAPGEGEYAVRLRALNCKVVPLHLAPLSNGQKTLRDQFSYLRSMLLMVGQLRRLLRVWRPDLLYVNGPRVLPAAARVSRKEGIPLLFHAHHRITQGSALRLAQSSLNVSRASVVACSSYVASSLAARVEGSRIRVIYNGVRDQEELPLRAPSPIQNVGIIGRIDPEKGQLDFVRAARTVVRRFPDLRFHVIGSPQLSPERYACQVLKESEGGFVRFHGWRRDISKVLRSLDLLVVSSPYTEATPRVILEAFSAGVPVLAYALGGIPEIIEDDVTGFLSAPTPEALAKRMIEILETNEVILHDVAQRARFMWEERFRIDQWRASVCDCVTNALRPNGVGFGAREPQVTV